MRRVAIVSGSFKPPHRGHMDMVRSYSKTCDEVRVLISTPGPGRERHTTDGRVISPETAKRVFEIYVEAEGLRNVTVEVSTCPSPVAAAYSYVATLSDVEVVFGASKKARDWHTNWKTALAYVSKNHIPVVALDPEETAVEPTVDDGSPVSSTMMREGYIKECLPASLSQEQVDTIMRIIGGQAQEVRQ